MANQFWERSFFSHQIEIEIYSPFLVFKICVNLKFEFFVCNYENWVIELDLKRLTLIIHQEIILFEVP